MDRLSNCARNTNSWGFQKVLQDKKWHEKVAVGNRIEQIILGAASKRLEFWKSAWRFCVIMMKSIGSRGLKWISWLMRIEIKVFHLKASKRRKKNKITGLFNDLGVWNTGTSKTFSSIFHLLGVIWNSFFFVWLLKWPKTWIIYFFAFSQKRS